MIFDGFGGVWRAKKNSIFLVFYGRDVCFPQLLGFHPPFFASTPHKTKIYRKYLWRNLVFYILQTFIFPTEHSGAIFVAYRPRTAKNEIKTAFFEKPTWAGNAPVSQTAHFKFSPFFFRIFFFSRRVFVICIAFRPLLCQRTAERSQAEVSKTVQQLAQGQKFVWEKGVGNFKNEIFCANLFAVGFFGPKVWVFLGSKFWGSKFRKKNIFF